MEKEYVLVFEEWGDVVCGIHFYRGVLDDVEERLVKLREEFGRNRWRILRGVDVVSCGGSVAAKWG